MPIYEDLLALARQFRRCPPLRFRTDPAHAEFYQTHLRRCPFCARREKTGVPEILLSNGTCADSDTDRSASDGPPPESDAASPRTKLARKLAEIASDHPAPEPDEMSPWTELARRLTEITPDHPTPEPVMPGQLRHIRKECARWCDSHFYSPPKVLVLDIIPASCPTARVAQTWHDTGLAAPGDLILSGEQAGGIPLMVECRNIYTVSADDLGTVTGTPGPDVADAVLRMAADPDALPEWAPLPRPLKDRDARRSFWRLEAEVAAVFALPDAGGRHDTPDAVRGVTVAIRSLVPDTWWEIPPDSADAAYATARRSNLPFPMAAATDHSEILPVNLFVIRRGRLRRFEILRAENVMAQRVDDRLAISARIHGLPPGLGHTRLICCLSRPESGPTEASVRDWDGTTGLFYAEFDTDADQIDGLSLAVVGEAEDES